VQFFSNSLGCFIPYDIRCALQEPQGGVVTLGSLSVPAKLDPATSAAIRTNVRASIRRRISRDCADLLWSLVLSAGVATWMLDSDDHAEASHSAM
jgi:hypothetical protein